MKNVKSLLFCILNLIFCLSILVFGIQRASAKEINIYSYRSPALLEPFTKEYEKEFSVKFNVLHAKKGCLLYTSPSPRDVEESRMPSSA